jgi:drug/metabolite transporter (DMT)-like permease
MRRTALFPLISVGAWGGMFAVLAAALHHVDVSNFTSIRYTLAALVFIAILVLREGARALRPDGRLIEVAILGTVGYAGFNLLLGLALGRTRPQNAALIVALTPLLTVLVRWVRDKARPRPATLGLIAAALVGVALVITKGHLDPGSFGVADLMMLGAVTGWAVYTHGASRFTTWSPLRYATLTALAGTLVVLVVTAAADVAGWQKPPTVGAVLAVWPHLLFVVGIGTVIALLTWNIGIRRLGAPNASLFMNLVPLVALAIAVVQGYRPGALELLGLLITVAAIVTANVLTRPRPTTATAMATATATDMAGRIRAALPSAELTGDSGTVRADGVTDGEVPAVLTTVARPAPLVSSASR